jgi:hypothetical protein
MTRRALSIAAVGTLMIAPAADAQTLDVYARLAERNRWPRQIRTR